MTTSNKCDAVAITEDGVYTCTRPKGHAGKHVCWGDYLGPGRAWT